MKPICPNDHWDKIKKTWKMLQHCSVVNHQLRALATKYDIDIPTLAEDAKERREAKGKRTIQTSTHQNLIFINN